MKTVAFFNNKSDVAKTSLVYHLSCMYADLGLNVVAADLDPQANLTSMFLEDEELEELWSEKGQSRTIHGALRPVLEGTGPIGSPHLETSTSGPSLVVGDLSLSTAEDELSSQWALCLDRKPRAFHVLSALWRILDLAATKAEAPLVLMDVGPNLGALNRAALIAADHVVVPLAPDLYSLQGLRNLGPTLRRWKDEWAERRARNPEKDLEMPEGGITPIGYVVMPHAVRLDRPVTSYVRSMERIPGVYARAARESSAPVGRTIGDDPDCLATLKHFRILMPLAQEARKPMFALKPADGTTLSHSDAVQSCYRDFCALALAVAKRSGVPLP